MLDPESERHLILFTQLVTLFTVAALAVFLAFVFKSLTRKEKRIMADLTQLTADVAAESTVVDSAITLLNGLKAALDAAGTDPVKLAALSASIQAKTTDLSNAVTANTQAA